jgi:hypothetical protein
MFVFCFEHFNSFVLFSVQEEKERREYINPELSLKAREEGNAFFKKGDFPAAVKAYTEAIKVFLSSFLRSI